MVGDTIRRIRKEKNLKSKDLAERANVSSSYLSLVEKGRVDNVSVTCLYKLSVALDVGLSDILS